MRQSSLFTDLYQLTMAYAYSSSGSAGAPAVFELFFRRCPFEGEYAIVAGYDLVQEILENFHFSEEDIRYLKSLPAFSHADSKFFETLRSLDLSEIEILGIPEGQLVFPREPILQVRGPILVAQLLESALLNAVNFSTLVATCARRIKMVAGEHRLIEFGLRRAQGPNGALTATRASFLGGFNATSNVLAGDVFKIPVAGTMAHSFVQSFLDIRREDLNWSNGTIEADLESAICDDGASTNRGELGAFLAYAKAFPTSCILLIDTYDTLLSGLTNALRVFKVMRKQGLKPLGVRLDSGDLVYLSQEVRKRLDEAGFHEAAIYATNELDETVIESLQDQGAAIDHYGVGTRLVTAAEDPSLGGVYKLVELNGQPRLKISAQTEKLILPAAKKLYRLYGADGHMLLDLLTEASEPRPEEHHEILAIHPLDSLKRARVRASRVEELLQPLWKKGRWLDHGTLSEKREKSLSQMSLLRKDSVRRANPAPYKVSVTLKLKALFEELYLRERPPTELS